MKKYIVLGVLFLLPITVYLFFATGVNNFVKLPVLTQNVSEISNFKDLNGAPAQLKERITVLGFFGEDLLKNKAYAFNLAHKIYKKNHEFEEFQFVILLPETARTQAQELKNKIAEIADTNQWRFAFGSKQEIENVFSSLQTSYTLDEQLASPYVFIIDKELQLRGRKKDKKEKETLYGFDSSLIAEINNKMSDDIKVVLAEYRLALKKYNKSKREI